MFAVSTLLKFLWKYLCFALAKSAYYLVKLKRGAYINWKTFVVLLKIMKTAKVQPSKSIHVYSNWLYISDDIFKVACVNTCGILELITFILKKAVLQWYPDGMQLLRNNSSYLITHRGKPRILSLRGASQYAKCLECKSGEANQKRQLSDYSYRATWE